MADAATIELKGKKDNLDKTLSESEQSIKAFGDSVKKVFAAIGAAIAVKKVFDFATGLMDLYDQQAEAEAKVETAIKRTGGAAGWTADQLKKMASDLQAVSTYGDEVTLSAQSILLTFQNVKGDEFKRATFAAADLAAALGNELEPTMQMLGRSLNDPLDGLIKLERAGILFDESQKNLITSMVEAGDIAGAQNEILNKLEAAYGGTAAEMAQAADGPMVQFWNRMGDIGESAGEALDQIEGLLMPAFEGFATILENVVIPILTAVIEQLIKWATTIGNWLMPVMSAMFDGMIYGFTAVQTAIENWRDVGTAAVLAYVLNVVRNFETVRHWLTTVLPDLLMWFGRNWKEIFTDIANGTAAVFTNIAKNLAEFWRALKSFFSGDGFDFNWTPLLDGFESTLKEMPKIAERTKGDIELGLEASLGEVSNRLAGAFDKNLQRNRKGVKDFFDWAMRESESTDLGGPNVTSGYIQTVRAKEEGKKEEKDKKDAEKKEEKDKKEEEKVSISTEDLLSLNKRISTAAAKPPEDKIVDAVQRAAMVQKEATKALTEIQEEGKRLQEGANALLGGILKQIPGAGALR